jgi:hypothetical protein
MILSEEETKQRPKLPTDPFIGPTNREPQANVATSSSHRRPSSPNPTLPDYETSQAQQPSTPKQRGGWRFWNGRVRKLLLYALVVYTSIALVISIPTFVFVSFSFQRRVSVPFPLSRTATGLIRATEVERSSQVQMGASELVCGSRTAPTLTASKPQADGSLPPKSYRSIDLVQRLDGVGDPSRETHHSDGCWHSRV